MSDVKRYTLSDGLLDPAGYTLEAQLEMHKRFTGIKQVVFASDFDALAAEMSLQAKALEDCRDLREGYEARIATLEAELAGYKESHEQYCPSASRVRELEALVKTLQVPAANGVEWHIRARELEAALREIADKADDPRHVAYEEACIARDALRTAPETFAALFLSLIAFASSYVLVWQHNWIAAVVAVIFSCVWYRIAKANNSEPGR